LQGRRGHGRPDSGRRRLERTGRFRIGGDQPVLDAEGRSRISMEDSAVALVDEAELPRFVQRRFTIGY
jgi:putative NADH-flavin reductase